MANVAFLGLGVMGFPMAGWLARKGHSVTVYNRTREKAERWSKEHGGSVAATGLVGGRDLPATVIPFLLRGVNLLGIEATNCPLPKREAAWRRLERDLPMELLDEMTTVIPLRQVPEIGRLILDGKVQGRVVVDVNA